MIRRSQSLNRKRFTLALHKILISAFVHLSFACVVLRPRNILLPQLYIPKDGFVTVMTKGEKVYRFYPKSTGGGVIGAETGIPSASVSVNGKIISKLRFPGEQ